MTTGHFDQLRAKLQERIKAANRARIEAAQQQDSCDHSWQRFKQTVPVDNNGFRGSAYFVVNGCAKCKHKELVDYVVSDA